MAQRRMFSPKIVGSDAFLDMPISTQALYFHLGMEADDDGFVNPKKVMRLIGASDDDLKVILGKKFVIPFANGVVVIKHWRMNNLMRKDRYHPSQYFKERDSLFVRLDQAYSTNMEDATPLLEAPWQPDGNQLAPEDRIGKDRIGKEETIKRDVPPREVVAIIDSFKEVNPSYGVWYANKTQRGAVSRLLKTHGLERLQKVIAFLPQSNTIPYVPTITSPYTLEQKWADLEAGLYKLKNKSISNQRVVL